MNGESVYDSDSDRVGAVADVVDDQDGQPAAIIIDFGPYLGSGDQNVAVPPSDVTKSLDHTTINRSKQRLSQAPDTPLPDYSSTQQ
jgi:sporulation protein YlmC with PRC-barrel domain